MNNVDIDVDVIEQKRIDDEEQLKEKINFRREARRRKILDNAKNRLEKLNGRLTPALTKHEMEQENNANYVCNYSDPEVEPDTTIRNASNVRENSNSHPLEATLLNVLTGDMGITATTTTTTTTVTKKRHILLHYRLHIILCALAALSTSISFPLQTSATNGFNIFIYSGVCVIVDLIFFRTQERLNPFLGLLVTMCGIKVQHANTLLQIFSIIQCLVIDLGVFVFSFCTFSCILVCMNEKYADVILIK